MKWYSHDMKIVFSGFVIDPMSGGEPQMAFSWIYGALKNGHEVHVFTPPDSCDKLLLFIRENSLKRIFVYPVPVPKSKRCLPGEATMYFDYYRWQKSLEFHVVSTGINGIDLAHHTSWGNLGLGSGLHNLGVPLIFGPAGGGTLADSRLKFFFEKDWKKERLRNLLRRLFVLFPFARASVTNASKILATNNASLELAKKLGAKSPELFLADSIPSIEIQERLEKPSNSDILFVARLLFRKGCNLAIRAFAEVLKETPEARLIIIGDGPALDGAKKLARDLAIDSKVDFLGRVAWKEVQEYYKTCVVFLLPTLRDTTGAQFFEAAAKGLPIVSLEKSGFSEWLQGSGVLTAKIEGNDQTVLNLAQKIKSVINSDPQEWMNMSEDLIQFSKSNTTEMKTMMMNQIYLRVRQAEDELK